METFDPAMKDLLLKRLEERAKEGRLHGIYQLNQHYTPTQIIDEAKRGTPAGDEFLMLGESILRETYLGLFLMMERRLLVSAQFMSS